MTTFRSHEPAVRAPDAPDRNRRRVAVVGLGVATALGLEVDEVWRAVLDGRSGIGRIRQFPSGAFPVNIGSEVDLGALNARLDGPPTPATLSRTLTFARWAADRAWDAAGLTVVPIDPPRAATCVGAGVFPAMESRLDGLTPALLDDSHAIARRNLERARRPEAAEPQDLGSVSLMLSARFGLEGPSVTVHSACASATQAVGEAYHMISSDRADVVLTGGADSMMSMFCVAGFTLLGALSRHPSPDRASRPFDRARDGFVLGEGAGIAVLEELEHARRRGAPILAEVIGYGSSLDAYRFTDVHPDGRGAVACMRRALTGAGVRPDEVGYVNAHGTSTYQNDRIETRALKEVFGDHVWRLAISSTKSQLGHLLCAAGGIEFVFTVLALRDQVLPPTINLDHPDPECDLDYVPHRSREAEVGVAISNSFGFGGQNGTVVVRHWNGAP
jgi:3-oxoacyl-[acyl-carrier-protein] synthase II